jgi:hypothetical protein
MIEIDETLFKERLNSIAATEDGKIVIAYLKEVLGWEDIMMSLENTEATTYYQTRRAVYGWIRKHINPDQLKQIEFNYTRKAITHDGRERSNTSSRKHFTGKQPITSE